MATVVIINPQTGEEDTKLPAYLASCAKLAAQAFVDKRETFTCPKSGQEIPVSKIRYTDKESETTLYAPGVEINYRNTLWQCWSGGITSKNNEYFRVRARDPLFYTIGKNGFSEQPNVKAFGSIFVNDAPDGSKTYNMSLRSVSQSAKNDLAEKLVHADMVSASELMGIDDEVDFGGFQSNSSDRSSSIKLGQ